MSWFRAAVAALVLALAAAGVLAVRAHWVDLGRAEVQQRWNAQVAADAAANAQHLNELQRMTRRDEARRQEEAERTAHEHHARIADLAKRSRSADARIRSLLDTIAALDAADHAVPIAGADAGAGPGVDGAAGARARELLGRCAVRYGAVAADAGKLAAQVIGLQQYAKNVCGAAPAQEEGADDH